MAVLVNGVARYCNVCVPCSATTLETVVAIGSDAFIGDTLTYQFLASEGGYCFVYYTNGTVDRITFAEAVRDDIRTVGGSILVDSSHEMFIFCPSVTVYRKMYVDTKQLCYAVQSLDALVSKMYEYGFSDEEMQAGINQYFEAAMRYTAIAIKSFTVSGNPVEKGRIIDSVILTWAANKTPVSIEISGVMYEGNQTEITLTDLALSGDTTWNLVVTDEFGATATEKTTLHFYNGVYSGASAIPEVIDSGFVRSLAKKLTGTRKGTYTVNAGSDQYIWFAIPVSLGTPTFKVNGFEGGFIDMGKIAYTNMYGYTADYRVWRSENIDLGNTTVIIE